MASRQVDFGSPILSGLTLTCAPAYEVLWFITTLCSFPYFPKYSCFFSTSVSASLADRPTTNTRFLWTTLQQGSEAASYLLQRILVIRASYYHSEGHITLEEIGYEISFTAILSLPLIKVGQLSVSELLVKEHALILINV